MRARDPTTCRESADRLERWLRVPATAIDSWWPAAWAYQAHQKTHIGAGLAEPRQPQLRARMLPGCCSSARRMGVAAGTGAAPREHALSRASRSLALQVRSSAWSLVGERRGRRRK